MRSKASSTTFVLVAYLVGQTRPDAIVHGIAAAENEFPFMAALAWRNNATGKEDILCGGVLISADLVLTAAHCVFFEGRVPDVVKVGGNKLQGGGNEVHAVMEHFIHPDYRSGQAYNDIALLRLSRISWKTPAWLFNDEIPGAYPVTAIGYGTTEFAGMKSEHLQKAQLRIVGTAKCQRYFKRKRQIKLGVQPSQVCAGDPERLRDTCQGDSGGPLLVFNNRVIGITSVGLACSGIPPAIYTRVSYFYDWIQRILGT